MPPSDLRPVVVTVPASGVPIRYLKAAAGCTPDTPPPYADGKYPAGTTGLFIAPDGPPYVGTSKTGLFYYRNRADDARLDEILADFLLYEHAQGRVPILFSSPDLDVEGRAAHALSCVPPPHVVRPSDPLYLVHSTSRAAGEAIRRDRAIHSFAMLCEQGRQPDWHSLRSDVLGEPPEFADYINLGFPGTPWVEVVPASHLAGRFLTPDDPYEPGWRFYFDAPKLIASGRTTRWCGGLKVRRTLRLDPFCVGEIDVAAVDRGRGVQQWTPRLFTEMADRLIIPPHAL